MAETLAAAGRRVKVYVLNGDGKWDDRGTGHVRVEPDSETKAFVLKVTSDETGRVSLASTIRATHEALYQMQEDNIISWNEEMPPGVPTEVALSFQETEGCRELWEKICHVDAAFKRNAAQRAASNRMHAGMNAHSASAGAHDVSSEGVSGDPLSSDTNVPSTAAENLHHHSSPTDGVPLVDPTAPDAPHPRFFDDSLENSAWNADAIDDVVFPDTTNVLFLGNTPASFVPTSSADAAAAATFVMPEPDRAGVEALARIMSDQPMLSMRAVREEIIGEVVTTDYVSKLSQVFRRAEHEGDLDCLAMLYHIIRCLFVIGNNGVLEILVDEKHMFDVIGCLEYDPDHMPELDRKKAEAKRKEERRKASSSPKQQAEDSGTATGVTLVQQPLGAQRQVVDTSPGEERPTIRSGEKPTTADSADATETAASSLQASADFTPSKDTSAEKDAQLPASSETSKRQEEGGDAKPAVAEEHIMVNETENRTDTIPAQLPSEKGHQSPAEKNGSEETSSSGNIPEGETSPFSLRTHRDYLVRKVVYRSVIPITDQSIVAKIHQNYRVAYIRDVILSRVFDDGMSNLLSGLILCNNVDIIMYFISGSNSMHELFTRLKAAVQNRRRLQEATESLEDRGQKQASRRNPTARKNQIEDKIVVSPNIASTDDDTRKTAIAKSGGQEPSEDAFGQENETNSSGSRKKGPTSNPVSLTTADSCPATDPNAISGEQSSRDFRSEEKPRFDSNTYDPKSSDQSEEIHRDLRSMLGLLRELCQIVKGQPPAVQARFHQMLLELGALEISVSLLLDKDPVLRSLCCDILSTAINHDQGDVRGHIVKNATQQDSSVPKEQIGPKSDFADAKRTEGGAIITEAGASGVTAEVAISNDETVSVRAQQHSAGSLATGDVDMKESNANPKSLEERAKDTGSATVPTKGHHSGSLSDSADKQNDAVIDVATTQSMDSNMQRFAHVSGTGQVTTASDASLASPLLGGAGVGTHPMVSASIGTAQKSSTTEQDEQNEQLRSTGLPSAENQSRVETDFPLLSAMVDVICEDKESGVALTVLSLLKTLLDPISMKPPHEKNEFLNVFYKKFVFRLMGPIEIAAHPERRRFGKEKVSEENVSHICDLMSYCVTNHASRSKYFVMGHNVGVKIAELVQHKRAHVRLAAIRFVRTCVNMRDGIYTGYIWSTKLLDPIMEMYAQNQYKDNLISSAVLELVSSITNKRLKPLMEQLVHIHADKMQPSEKKCSVFEETKRVLDEIEKGKDVTCDVRDENKKIGVGNAAVLRPNEVGGGFERSGSPVKSGADGGGVFVGHLDAGDLANPMMLHSANFRDGAMGGTLRFGTGSHGPDMRMFSDEDGFFSRLAGGSDVMHKLYGADHDSSGLKLGGMGGSAGPVGRNAMQEGGARRIEPRAGTARGVAGKTCAFKTGLRSVSKSAVQKRGQVGVKAVPVTGLRSKAVSPVDAGKTKCTGTSDLNDGSGQRGIDGSSEGESDTRQCDEKDFSMSEACTAKREEGECSGEAKEVCDEAWKGKAVRMSLSKSQVKNGELGELNENEGVIVSESSEDRHSPRKRERVDSEKGIEICTKTILGRISNGEGSPPKRRRVAEGTAVEKTEKADGVVGEGSGTKKDGRKESVTSRGDGDGDREGEQEGLDRAKLDRGSPAEGD